MCCLESMKCNFSTILLWLGNVNAQISYCPWKSHCQKVTKPELKARSHKKYFCSDSTSGTHTLGLTSFNLKHSRWLDLCELFLTTLTSSPSHALLTVFLLKFKASSINIFASYLLILVLLLAGKKIHNHVYVWVVLFPGNLCVSFTVLT